jgi:hypothetical protein
VGSPAGSPQQPPLPAATIETALTIVREQYPDFGPTFVAKKLHAVHGL